MADRTVPLSLERKNIALVFEITLEKYLKVYKSIFLSPGNRVCEWYPLIPWKKSVFGKTSASPVPDSLVCSISVNQSIKETFGHSAHPHTVGWDVVWFQTEQHLH